jgi:hypothetical protein
MPLTTINIYVENLDTISKLKNRRETQYDFVQRLLAEWQDLKDYRLNVFALCFDNPPLR